MRAHKEYNHLVTKWENNALGRGYFADHLKDVDTDRADVLNKKKVSTRRFRVLT
ncbi:hypothetical protein SAMN05421736_11487 [Evansella caseinilytica]|uniref:Uncharacterized protein n=1 Tax=Evansella caseinilytica TaxID=1503961 RepID=A0A1H3TF73_9BACI|nr:hypothetical protein SAMN05421736_11487 [Evansella caseinilytica]